MQEDNQIEPHLDGAMANSLGKKFLMFILFAVAGFFGLVVLVVVLESIFGDGGKKYFGAIIVTFPIAFVAWFFRHKINRIYKALTVTAIILLGWFVIASFEADDEAVRKGFSSASEMENAAEAGFSDKAPYEKHLADMAAAKKVKEDEVVTEAAAREKAEREQAKLEAVQTPKGKTLGQWLDEQSTDRRSEDQTALRPVRRLPDFCYEIIEGCNKFVPANRACAAADDYGDCMERMGDDTWYADKNRCNADGTLREAEASSCQ